MFSLWFYNEKGLFNAQTDCLSLRKIPQLKQYQFCILDAFALTNEFHSHLLMRANSDGDVHPYLIFVIFFFTLAKFLENKIYTEKRKFLALNL